MTTLHPNSEQYDLVVIGGGINGAAIARDAALRGMKVILLEKEDFGSGASTKTSKLAHGGVRYLEHFQLRLVKESLRERELLLKNASHLVKPLSFILPIYSNDPHPLWQIHAGLFLYDCLGGNKSLPRHRKLDAKNLLQAVSGLKSDGLLGGCSYFDAQMQDHRILIENIVSAAQAGATVCNYTEVIDLIHGEKSIEGVRFREVMTNRTGEIYGRVIVNVTGAWSANISSKEPNVEHCLPAPTKGIHIVIPQINAEEALLLRAPQDERVFFIMPWGKFSLVGTTDTFFDGDPDHIKIETFDTRYLLDAVNAFFPEAHLVESSVIASFAGLRPLVAPNGHRSPSDIARECAIQISKGGLITVLGGKYTTHRQIAEDVVDKVAAKIKGKRFLPCMTAQLPLPGAIGIEKQGLVKQKLEAAGLPDETVIHLLNTYGMNSLAVLERITENPSEAERICAKHPHIWAELTYSIQNEYVKTAADWLERRTEIAYLSGGDKTCENRVKERLFDLSQKNLV